MVMPLLDRSRSGMNRTSRRVSGIPGSGDIVVRCIRNRSSAFVRLGGGRFGGCGRGVPGRGGAGAAGGGTSEAASRMECRTNPLCMAIDVTGTSRRGGGLARDFDFQRYSL